MFDMHHCTHGVRRSSWESFSNKLMKKNLANPFTCHVGSLCWHRKYQFGFFFFFGKPLRVLLTPTEWSGLRRVGGVWIREREREKGEGSGTHRKKFFASLARVMLNSWSENLLLEMTDHEAKIFSFFLAGNVAKTFLFLRYGLHWGLGLGTHKVIV